MDDRSPDQCGASESRRTEEAHRVLLLQPGAVLAMSSGGCARYAFSCDTHYCLDRRGYPLIHYTSGNPHHHLILTNSSMSLRLPHKIDADGNELSLLIITGALHLVDPGDHDSIDRHFRYFKRMAENFSRGAGRLYRFIPDGVFFELISGERQPLEINKLLKRNPFNERDESRLIEFASKHLRHLHIQAKVGDVIGIDGYGLDTEVKGTVIRKFFHTCVEAVGDAEMAITGLEW